MSTDQDITQGYRGNSRLKKLGVQIDWTPDMVKEYLKCSKDPVYFAETYMKIVHVDRGLIPLKLFDYQKRMINLMAENRFVISAQSRQSGKTTTACAFILWYIIFNADKTVGMLANKGETAREILSRVKLAYQYLPKWMQHGIVDFNKGSFVLENNSKVIAASTSNDNVRGFSFSCVAGATLITIRDKETGFTINNISIHELEFQMKARNMSYGFVYLTENKINGKKYIGAHRTNTIKGNKKYLGSGKNLLKAIKKYGKEAFNQVILEFAFSEDQLFELEKKYIADFDAVANRNYYNIAPGGKNCVLFGEANGFYGKKHSKETRAIITKARKGATCTEEEKQQRSETLKLRFSDPEYAAAHKERMNNRNNDSYRTEEFKNQASIRRKGCVVTDQQKQKQSEAMIANFENPEYYAAHLERAKNRDNSGYRTDDFKQQARERRITWNKSDEKKELNRKVHTGRKRSPETCKRISDALKASNQKKRQKNCKQ